MNNKNITLKIIEIIFILISVLVQNMLSYKDLGIYIFLILLILLYKNNKNKKYSLINKVFSVLFSCFITFGNTNAIENFEKYNIHMSIYFILSFIGLYFLFNNIFIVISSLFSSYSLYNDKYKNISKRKFILINTIVGFILYLPFLLMFFPGIFSDDTYSQLSQILHIIPYGNHHPIMHTFIIKIFYSIGYIISNKVTIGILFYTLFQMLFVSFTFSNIMYFAYSKGLKKIYLLVLFIFYYLLPFNGLYSVALYKDVLFGCVLLLFVLFLYNNINNDLKTIQKLELLLLTILVCLLRTNGLLVILLLIIFLLIIYKKLSKDKIIILFLGFIISVSFNFVSTNMFNVQKVDFVESLSIPLQNIAYTVSHDGNISKEEFEYLNKIIDTKEISMIYDNDFSDPIKNLVRRTGSKYLEDNKALFIKNWFSIGLKNKLSYLKSYSYQTNGYWFHNKHINHVYDRIIDDNYDINHKILLPKFLEKILNLMILANRALLHFIFSNALCFYLILLCLKRLIERKENIIYILPLVFLWCTLLIATPVGYEFRYFYGIFISFPFILISTFDEKHVK